MNAKQYSEALARKDRRIADLNGIMDTMRENAVDREKRIAELKGANQTYLDNANFWRVKSYEAEAELADLRARRCEGCAARETCDVIYDLAVERYFYCSRWVGRRTK